MSNSQKLQSISVDRLVADKIVCPAFQESGVLSFSVSATANTTFVVGQNFLVNYVVLGGGLEMISSKITSVGNAANTTAGQTVTFTFPSILGRLISDNSAILVQGVNTSAVSAVKSAGVNTVVVTYTAASTGAQVSFNLSLIGQLV